MANEESLEHEWDIFERIDKLELISTVTKPLLHDALVLAKMALMLAFINMTTRRPEGARKLKDSLMHSVKHAGLSEESLRSMETILLILCDTVEQQ